MTTSPLFFTASSNAQIAVTRASASWPWYIVRASGFAATGLLILIMLSGIGMVTGLTYRVIEPVKAWALHKAMSLALLAAIVFHIGFLLIDHFVSFSFFQLVVPFLSQYTNQTKLLGLPLGAVAISMGILAMYGIVAIVASSLGWIDTKKTAWRWIHYSSYIVMLLVLLHALYTGTDVRYGTFRLAFIAGCFVVVLGLISRLRRSGSLKRDD